MDDKWGMTHAEKGAYSDLVDYQFKHDRFTIEEAKKVIGHRFNRLWPALLKILDCVDDRYFIPWVDDSIYETMERKAKFSERATDSWKRRKQIGDVKKRLRL